MLNNFYIEDHVRKALEEDIGFGDVTTDYLTDEKEIICCELNSRVDGIFCGKAVFEMVFKILSPEVIVKFYCQDGDKIFKGTKIAEIKGPAKYILLGERVSLNYVQQLSRHLF